MSRNKKPRKPYRPKAAAPFAGISLLMGAQIAKDPMTDSDASELEIVALTALDAIAHGHGTRREWDALTRCINQSWTLANRDIGAEAIPVLLRAKEAMSRVAVRFMQAGKIAFDGDGLQAVREAIVTWGAQIRIATVGEIAESARMVEKHYPEKMEAI
jgi:hypothetical protein